MDYKTARKIIEYHESELMVLAQDSPYHINVAKPGGPPFSITLPTPIEGTTVEDEEKLLLGALATARKYLGAVE